MFILHFFLPFYCPSVYFYLCDLENSDFLLKLWYCMLVFHVSLQGTMKWNTVNYASSVHGSAFQIKRKRIESIELNTLQIQRFFLKGGGSPGRIQYLQRSSNTMPQNKGFKPPKHSPQLPPKESLLTIQELNGHKEMKQTITWKVVVKRLI